MKCTSCRLESQTLYGEMWRAEFGFIIQKDESICVACASIRPNFLLPVDILKGAEIKIAEINFIGYALYNFRVNRTAKGKDTMVGVIAVDDMYSNIKIAGHTYKWVATSKLKPYLDPDADGKQWLFLDYIIMEQDHPDLLKYAIYSAGRSSKSAPDLIIDDEFVNVADTMNEAKQIVLNAIKERK